MREYDLVVIGSSAGGIEALSTLVATLPTDFEAPLVIAQHLDPAHVSHLGEILSRHTALPVRTVVGREALVPGVIYVVPADRDVEINDHEVGLFPHGVHRSIPSVNRLFSSAARTHGDRLICVILTGAGSDGASGARDVKATGGTVIIENPATAAYASMPQSLALSLVDLVIDLPQIGPLLGDLVAGNYTPSPVEAEHALPTLLSQVRERTGVDFSTYKPPTILRRLQRRLAATHVDSLTAYLEYLPDHPQEYQQLLASFLIQVTEFFRDPEFFATLRDEVLPPLVAQAREEHKTLRCWSAGCATGEEAYSLAILLADLYGDDLDSVPARIFATDVDAESIAFARRGVYPPAALASLPAEMVARAFTPVDGAYEIIPAIRNLVIFGQHDLGARAPFPQIDLVLCRNVLIYFTNELQRRVLQLFAFALRDGGFLALGKAETPGPLAAYFAPVSNVAKLYRRQGTRVVVPPPRLLDQPLFITPPSRVRRHTTMPPIALPPVREKTIASEYIGAILLNSAVGVIVVDHRYDIHALNRAAQQLLGIFRPALGEDLIHLVTTELAQPLRTAIDAAFASQIPQSDIQVALTIGAPRVLHMTLISAQATVLLHITDVTSRVKAQQEAALETLRNQQLASADAPIVRRTSASQRQQIWEAERQQLREENTRLALQLEQMTASNQILRLANDEVARVNLTIIGLNEDLVVRNEEFQASSEEIKTLNEELQATNEELETLNEEMEATVEELRATNDDLVARTVEVQQLASVREAQRQASEANAVELTAIMLSMGDALLVVNQAGEVRLTNAAYIAMFGDSSFDWIAEDDEGRPLPLPETPRQRLLTGQPFRMVFTQTLAEDRRRWLEASGEPIRLNDAVTGAVLTIRDITDRSLRRLQDEFLALATHELRTPLTSIQAAAQLMELRLQPSEEHLRPMLSTMLRQLKRQQRLIDDLADVSRLQHGKLRLTLVPVDLEQIVSQTIETFVLVVSQPPIVVTEQPHEPLFILADRVRLEQILTNLLSNACKYASASPQIDVRIRQVGQDAEIQVQDAGPGIAPNELPMIFQRFYQANADDEAARNGLGLGLYLTHELVGAQGGQIDVSSELGQGTTFTVRFPILPPTA